MLDSKTMKDGVNTPDHIISEVVQNPSKSTNPRPIYDNDGFGSCTSPASKLGLFCLGFLFSPARLPDPFCFEENALQRSIVK